MSYRGNRDKKKLRDDAANNIANIAVKN